MKKTTKIQLVFAAMICLLICTVIIKVFVGEKQYLPKITEHEFPFIVEYEMNGETFIIEDSVICKFSGFDLSSLTLNKPRSWEAYLKSGDEDKCIILSEENQESRIKEGQHNEWARLRIFYGSPRYYMGEPDAEALSHSEPQIVYYQTYKNHYNWGTRLSLEELEQYFGIKITRFEFSKPIVNYFGKENTIVKEEISATEEINASQEPTSIDVDQGEETDMPLGNDSLHTFRIFNDIGTSRHLNGRVAVYCFFVDDDESEWSDAECERFLNEQIQPALDFISDEAENWNVGVEFDINAFCPGTAPFSLKYSGKVNEDLMNGGSTKDIFSQMAVNMGYLSDCDFAIKEEERISQTDTVYLMLLNKKGRSYARNLYSNGESYYIDDGNAEHCVIFSKDIDSFGNSISLKERSATVAHEILHLFGAEDYYKTERINLADRHYYYDIMTLNTRSISRLEIMEMTAFMLGWTDEVPELCYDSRWYETYEYQS